MILIGTPLSYPMALASQYYSRRIGIEPEFYVVGREAASARLFFDRKLKDEVSGKNVFFVPEGPTPMVAQLLRKLRKLLKSLLHTPYDTG